MGHFVFAAEKAQALLSPLGTKRGSVTVAGGKHESFVVAEGKNLGFRERGKYGSREQKKTKIARLALGKHVFLM